MSDDRQLAAWALGVAPDASPDVVREAYRRLALEHHPDRLGDASDEERRAAEERFRRIDAAKRVMLEPPPLPRWPDGASSATTGRTAAPPPWQTTRVVRERKPISAVKATVGLALLGLLTAFAFSAYTNGSEVTVTITMPAGSGYDGQILDFPCGTVSEVQAGTGDSAQLVDDERAIREQFGALEINPFTEMATDIYTRCIAEADAMTAWVPRLFVALPILGAASGLLLAMVTRGRGAPTAAAPPGS